nr:hypothetical protein Q903MT_gene1696 [Picea sitchensis]
MYRLTTPPLSNPDPLLQVEATQSTDTAMEYTFYFIRRTQRNTLNPFTDRVLALRSPCL